MTNLPPDDNLPDPPQLYGGQEGEQDDAQEAAYNPYTQETSQEHAFQSQGPNRESSGFGFVALVAGLLCLAALSGIVIYSLLLAPTPPRQPILIEAEGTTKQAPAEAQVKPEPNSNASVFRMLRGTDATQNSTEKNAPLIVKPGAPQETDSDGLSDSSSESSAEAEQRQTEQDQTEQDQTEQDQTEQDEEKTEIGKETAANATSIDKETTRTTEPAEQETASASGAWYVQIAALESRAAADKAWAKLHDQLPDLLYTQNYVAKAATLASGRRVWRLLLGPQPRRQAETLCRELKTRTRSCLVKKIAP